jgi:hypothetical protein
MLGLCRGEFNLSNAEDGVLSSAFMVGLLVASLTFASLAKRLALSLFLCLRIWTSKLSVWCRVDEISQFFVWLKGWEWMELEYTPPPNYRSFDLFNSQFWLLVCLVGKIVVDVMVICWWIVALGRVCRERMRFDVTGCGVNSGNLLVNCRTKQGSKKICANIVKFKSLSHSWRICTNKASHNKKKWYFAQFYS